MSNSITAESLYAQLGLPQCALIIDVRKPAAYGETPRMLPGARRGAPGDIAGWCRRLPKSRPVTVYCVHGHEVGREAAATLCALGFDARFLEGGIAHWMAAGLPTVARRDEWHAPGNETHHSRWVTRERSKIDRLACPWLVRRFIDPYASFFYVPASEVRSQAIALQAQPYDIPDTVFSHRGPLCSFDAFLADFDLHDPAIDAMARIVRAAEPMICQARPTLPAGVRRAWHGSEYRR
jgi:rhodanese-related sulfurtransferase